MRTLGQVMAIIGLAIGASSSSAMAQDSARPRKLLATAPMIGPESVSQDSAQGTSCWKRPSTVVIAGTRM